MDLLGQYTYRQNYAIQTIHSEQVLKQSHLGTQKKKIQTTEHMSKRYHDNPIVDAAYQSWPCSLLALVELPRCGIVFNTGCHRRKQPLRS